MSSADGKSSTIIDNDDVSGSLSSSRPTQRTTRRLLRSAVRDRDVLTLRRMLADVDVNVVNSAMSDVLSCSALAYAARWGYLEVVEALIDTPGCHVDRTDSAKRSALDEAIDAWAAAAASSSDGAGKRQHDCAKQYRIVRRLLAAGARCLSRPVLDTVVSSAALDSSNGRQFIRKLVKVNYHRLLSATGWCKNWQLS